MKPMLAYPTALAEKLAGEIPRLVSARLVLRAPRLADFDSYSAFLASDDARYMGGPHNRDSAWCYFASDTAHWLTHGFGALMIEREGRLAGQVAITVSPRFPEPELGWMLFPGFTGQGYATEAAFLLRDWAYAEAGLATLVSYVDPHNTASAAVARRLGAAPDPEAPLPLGETGDETVVYRHPAPEALADGGMEAYV